jgi:ABC-2 type transport system permease protein
MNDQVEKLNIAAQVIQLLIFDAVIISVALALLLFLKFSKHATYAVMKRNFYSYFSNPTGYVFICLFVFLCSLAAFFSRGFFEDNLATLHELNEWFPYIMLLFVPAITMNIWAAERNEGTDELLLTIPATDADIVLGKYLSAAAIYGVSLLISQVSIFIVLDLLAGGDLEIATFITSYIGYLWIGLAMIAIGMSASFLTSNLTVAFILGALFNAPLVALKLADRWVANRDLAQTLSSWSLASRFEDFGQGVVSFASLISFALILLFGLYLSMIFIGRRHWLGGRDGQSLLPHFVVRGAALALVVLFGSKFLAQTDRIRWDATKDKVNSLSSDTKRLLQEMGDDQVLVEAFISGSVPTAFVQTRSDLLSVLHAFETNAGKQIEVRIYDDMEPYTEQAKRAKDQYNIEPRRTPIQTENTVQEEELFLAVALTKGLQREIIPFFHRGIPVEYELARALTALNKTQRKRIGVVQTEARMMGGFDMQSGQRPKERIIEELEKLYDVEDVNLAEPVTAGKFDVLVAVQPSSLTQPELVNLMDAIRDGIPTAVFEDPFPYFYMGQVTPTGEPRRPAGGGMFGMRQQPPEPKCNIQALWEMLGVEMVGSQSGGFGGAEPNVDIVWQDFNPYREKIQLAEVSPEWVFVSPDAPGAEANAFNGEDTVTSGLGEVLLLYPGALRDTGARGLSFTPLLQTSDERTGTVASSDLQSMRDPRAIMRLRSPTDVRYTLAARIRGQLQEELNMSDEGSPDAAGAAETSAAGPAATGTGSTTEPETKDDKNKKPQVNVVFVSDIDVLSQAFMALRESPDEGFKWNFENVTFVLNLIDSLAGDESLVTVRKRKIRPSTLKLIDQQTNKSREETVKEIKASEEETNKKIEELRAKIKEDETKLRTEIEELEKSAQRGDPSVEREIQEKARKLMIQQLIAAERLNREIAQLERERDRRIDQINHELRQSIEKVQSTVKTFAAIFPPIPPLLVGLVVWIYRRSKETEGVVAERRR